jgi:YgiT-type zinc finger domain-containing protein
MNCAVCGAGVMTPGTTRLTIERGKMTLVIRSVPALVCGQCEHAIIDEDTARCVEQIADEAEAAGVTVEIREYACA